MLTPEALAEYVGDAATDGWDVVSTWAPGFTRAEYADAGATWLVESTTPVADWVGEFRDRVLAGPSD